MEGYTGKIAWVDLHTGKVLAEELEQKDARKYLGGKGLGAYLLYRHLLPGVDPYSPENMLIFLAGPLTGTTFPCTGRGGVVTKSPMTGTFLDSYAGGLFGPCIRYAGYAALVITGKAEKPVYLEVDQGGIAIKDASHLWGLSTFETEERLRGGLKTAEGGRVAAAVIGPAGERLVRFSGILTERRTFGRGGAGAVMGAKHLKALVIRGDGKVKAVNEAAFKQVVKRAQDKIAEHPVTKKGGVFPQFGTIMTVDLTQETGTLPTRNWRENTFTHAREINGDAFNRRRLRPRACYLCPIACSRDSEAAFGNTDYLTEGPEYETIFAFGSNLRSETRR